MAQCENESIFLSNDTEKWVIFSAGARSGPLSLSLSLSIGGVANVNWLLLLTLTALLTPVISAKKDGKGGKGNAVLNINTFYLSCCFYLFLQYAFLFSFYFHITFIKNKIIFFFRSPAQSFAFSN